MKADVDPHKDLSRGIVSRIPIILSVFCITWIVSSCSPAATAVGTATFTASPLTATFSPTPTATETQAPSQTPTRTQTSTYAPTLSLTQNPTANKYPGMQSIGPFFVVSEDGDQSSSVTFIDFSGTTQWTVNIPHPESKHYLQEGISPDWKWYAYVTGSVDPSGTYPEGGVVLHLLNLMTGEVRDIANLLPQDFLTHLERMVKQTDPGYCGSNPEKCLPMAVGLMNNSFHSLDWSPDGKYLAFGAMLDGDSADINVYNIDTEKIRRLENGPGNPQSFSWSPDSQWVLYEEIPFYSDDHAAWLLRDTRWAVRRDGQEVKKLPRPVTVAGWISDNEYLAYFIGNGPALNWSPTVINIQTGNAYVNFNGSFWGVTVDSRSRLMAVLGAVACNGEPGCDLGKDYGLYLGPINGKLHRIADRTVLENIFHDDLAIGLTSRGGTNHPFTGGGNYGEAGIGITAEGKFDNLDYSNRTLISQNYWLASFPGQGIRVYDPADKLRFKLSNEQRITFDEAYWDTNAQGIFYLTWVDHILEIYYWKLGEPTPRWIADIPEGDYFSLALLVNLKSLPHLRIFPTRAAKPAEGTSIWSQTKYRELTQPGANHYDVTIPADSSWRWSFSLGTTDPKLFEKILSPEDVEFFINGEKIDSNMFRMSDQTEEGRFSRAWATMLSGWRSGDRAELEIHYTLRSAVADGNVVYPAGEYRQIISLVVE
jgi:hypothetical protein